MARLELYGTARCPHTGEMREWLEWKRSEFVEYDVEADPVARATHARDLARPAHRAHPGRGRQGSSGRVARSRLHRRRVVTRQRYE